MDRRRASWIVGMILRDLAQRLGNRIEISVAVKDIWIDFVLDGACLPPEDTDKIYN